MGKRKKDKKYEDFEILEVIGKGAFGRVLRVRDKETNKIYAMKMMRKKDVIKNQFILHANKEREIMHSLKHPFITSNYLHHSSLLSTIQFLINNFKSYTIPFKQKTIYT